MSADTARSKHAFDVAWKTWVAVLGSSFGIIESVALHEDKALGTHDIDHDGVNDDGFSLSAHVRKWVSIKGWYGRTIWLVGFGIFSAWFGSHITARIVVKPGEVDAVAKVQP